MQCFCFCRRDLVNICKTAVKIITVVLVWVVVVVVVGGGGVICKETSTVQITARI